jgi:hypothetical protein
LSGIVDDKQQKKALEEELAETKAQLKRNEEEFVKQLKRVRVPDEDLLFK